MPLAPVQFVLDRLLFDQAPVVDLWSLPDEFLDEVRYVQSKVNAARSRTQPGR